MQACTLYTIPGLVILNWGHVVSEQIYALWLDATLNLNDCPCYWAPANVKGSFFICRQQMFQFKPTSKYS